MRFGHTTLLALSLCVLAAPAYADIAGSYKCTGYDPDDKSSYNADLMVTKTGDTYSFKWTESDSSFSGTGLYSKSSADVVAAEFWNPKNQNKSGVIIYQAKPDGVLDGTWAYSDKATIGTESCKKQD